MSKDTEQNPTQFLHFKVIEILGKGGNGTVYRVENTKTGQIFALKTLHQKTEVTLNRFKKEFFALKRMDHPHIVKVYQSFFDHSPPFFTMEWIQGKTLGRIIADMKKNPLIFAYEDREDVAVRVCQQLCDVLSYIHGFDEIHRDLKPENIFITQGQGTLLKDFHIKILDFGLLKQLNANQANRNTQQGMVVGTVQFLSPEQAKGGHLDARSDLFSVGVILYNILALELPFQAKDLVAYLFQIVFEEPQPIDARVPDISPGMAQIVQKLLQKDPSKRFPSAHSLVRALDSRHGPPVISEIRAEDFLAIDPFEGFGDPLLPPCLVARDQPLDEMLKMAHSHRGQTPAVVAVKAENGLGKTFLINEWQSKLGFESKTILKLTFSNQLLPTQDPIGMLMDNLIRDMKPDEIQETFKDIYPFLSGVSRYLGRFFDMRSVGSLDHLSSGRKLQLIASNFVKLIRKLAHKGPVIMVLEDAHQAPERFFGWLTIFLDQINVSRFMLVISLTPDHRHPSLGNILARLERNTLFHEIELKPIQKDETRNLLQSMIPVNKAIPFAEPLDLFIYRNSGGNPHLAIELFTRLYEEKALVIERDELILKDNSKVRLPQSIHQALLLKIQKLPPQAMQLVEAASSLGNEFELSWLKGMLNWNEETFYSIFLKLIRSGVFREEEEPIHKAYFQNVDLTQHIYASLKDTQKTHLHNLAAKSIERLYNSRKDDPIELDENRISLYLESLFLHYSRCRNFVHATKYAYFCGNLALEQKNTTRAIALYEECLKMMSYSKNHHTVNLVNLKLGEVHLADHRFQDAISYFENCRKNPKKSKIEELRIYKGLTEAYRNLNQFDRAKETCQTLVRLSRGCSSKVVADSHLELGFLFWESNGDGTALHSRISKAEKANPTLPDLPYLRILGALGSNRLKEAVGHIKMGKELEMSPTPFLIALAWLNYMSGQFKKGFSYLDSLKKGEKQFQVSPRYMVFKSLMTFLLKRKIAPDHSADEYLHMAEKYILRFGLDSLLVYLDLFRLEDLLLNDRSESALHLLEPYRNGNKALPDTFIERHLFIFMALNAIWRQVEVPPRTWLDEFNAFQPEEKHPFFLEFHYALALNANALLPLSGNIQAAADWMRRSLKHIKRFNLKYFQAILLKNQYELFEKIEEPTLLENVRDEYESMKTYLHHQSSSN